MTAGPADTGLRLLVDPQLRLFLPPARRPSGEVSLRVDDMSTIGHLVQAAGVPLTEVDALELQERHAVDRD